MIIPEPFFVHSELTTGIQLADLIAYIISWGFRFSDLDKPCRDELSLFVEIMKNMRFRTIRDVEGSSEEKEIWSILYV